MGCILEYGDAALGAPNRPPPRWIALASIHAHERKRERIRGELDLAEQQALEMLTDSYELLDRVKEIIASKVARSMLNLGSEDRGARGIQYAFGGSPHSHLPVCQL